MMERAFAGFAALPPPGTNWRSVLGLRGDVNATVIEHVYRQLAKKRHPDNGGSTAAMAELNAARDAALREIGA